MIFLLVLNFSVFIILLFFEFFTPVLTDGFCGLSDSKSPQVPRTLLSILTDLNYAVVSMVSTRSLVSKSSNPSSNHLVTALRAPIIIGITVIFMPQSFFNSLTRSRYFIAIIINNTLILENIPHRLMVFQVSLSDGKSSQVSMTLRSILAVLNNAVVWTVFTRPIISKFCIPCTNSFVIVPSAPVTIGITITFMFHSFFNPLARSRYLSFLSFSFNFTL